MEYVEPRLMYCIALHLFRLLILLLTCICNLKCGIIQVSILVNNNLHCQQILCRLWSILPLSKRTKNERNARSHTFLDLKMHIKGGLSQTTYVLWPLIQLQLSGDSSMSNLQRNLAKIVRISLYARFLPRHAPGPTRNDWNEPRASWKNGDVGSLVAVSSQRSGWKRSDSKK